MAPLRDFLMRPLPILLLLLAAAPGPAQDVDPFALGGPGGGGAKLSQAELVSGVTAIAPGEPFTVALKLTHPEGWHSYFHYDGIGISKIPEFRWDLPEGFTAGEIEWPVPHRTQFVGLFTYGYEGTNYLPVTITPPADAATGGEVTISLQAAWQTCKEQCVDESGSFSLTLPVRATAEANPDVRAALEEYGQTHFPAEMPDTWEAAATDGGGTIQLRLTTGAPLPPDLYFFGYDGQIDAQADQVWTALEDGTWLLTVPRNKGNFIAEDPGPVLDRLKG
ncbi:MAG: hypothetical protein HKO57_01325, partial [Akkermansiaceae bacterium]|nr:hypothetical protein [Akkermansiaceae bacterium]